MKINTLTAAEESLMQLLWELNVFYLKDVMTQHPEPKLHQNTISTYLKILVDKAFLKTEKEGRIFKYSVAVPREKYIDFLLKNIANHYFNDDPEALKAYLVKSFNLKTEAPIVRRTVKVETPIPVKEEATSKTKTVTEDPVAELVEEILQDKRAKKDKKKDKKGKSKEKEKDKDKEKDKSKDKKKKK